MQNHLLQILTIVAMEKPVTLDAQDVRNEKVKVLRAIDPLSLDQVLVGQYSASADGKEPGYLDDPTVPKGNIQEYTGINLICRISCSYFCCCCF